jgi:DNA polymerase III delta subunit
LKAELVDPAWESFNFVRLADPDLKQVVDAAATVPFGPGNRLVLIDQCALFTRKKSGKEGDGEGGSKSTKIIDDFDAALKMVAPNTFLLFACIANFDKTLKTSKVAMKHVKVEEFEKLKYLDGKHQSAFVTFCNQEAKKNNVRIDDDACMYLADSTEINLRQIATEIEKTATYILPEKHIRLEHVMLMSPHFSNVFALLEYWAAGKPDQVLELIQELQSRQVSAHMILAGMQTVLSKWIGYRAELERSVSMMGGGREVRKREPAWSQVAAKINPNPWMQKNFVEPELKRIFPIPLERLTAKKRELTNIEFRLKTGQKPEGHALEAFVTR